MKNYYEKQYDKLNIKHFFIIISGMILTVAIVLFNIAFDFVPKTMKSSEIPTEINETATVLSQNNTVNLNTADYQELSSLKLVGGTRAQAIIRYREKNGKFKSIEEIKNVYGIGDTIYEINKDRLTVD